MRTKEEIQKQVDGLQAMKKWLPEFSAFNNPNHKGIDAQLDIIEGKKNMSDFEEFNEDDFDDEEEYNYIEQHAYAANEWLDGSTDEDLYEEE